MSHTLKNKTYYELFNVQQDATADEIKYAYARLIRQFTNESHPEEFMYIRKAYQVLSNPSTRQDYDHTIFSDATDQEDYDEQDTYYDHSYHEQENTYQESYRDYDAYDNHNYDNQNYENQNYDHYTYDNKNHENYSYDNSQQETHVNTREVVKSSPQYGLFGNVIFSIILSLIFTPIVGIIAGVIIHYFKIPISSVLGCLFWVFIALVVFALLFG